MMKSVSRRAFLGGAMSAVASVALADAPLRSLRPVARDNAAIDPASRVSPLARTTTAEMIAEANLGGTVGFVVADMRTGTVLENTDGAVSLPPASVAKAVTALYALDRLGPAHQFQTRIIANGVISDGILNGNLILAGGGDPILSTDHLADMAAQLKETGLREVRGKFQVWGGALPYINEIEPGQLDYLSYNPALSGLNLNFNRVHFEWTRSGGDYRVTMEARSERYRPGVGMARMRVVGGSGPVFAYADGGGYDDWSVARSALADGGARWLPVRKPALYAGDVFATLARAQEIALAAPEVIDDLPDGDVLVTYGSDALRDVLHDMLEYSTNLTAEVAGLAATQADGNGVATHAGSARAMGRWLAEKHGARADFADHSGLSDASRISALEMVQVLVSRASGPLRPILKDIAMVDEERNVLPDHPATVVAKTGTLNFVSCLAGYVRTAGGTDLAFAIFAADLDRRAAAKARGDEVPEGAIGWNRRAKRLQQRLLQRWGLVYAG